MVGIFHKGVCWLLSAVLLLTNGWPVAVQHAHDVGDNPYYHSHAGRCRSAAATPVVSDGELSSVTEHVHLLFLGWELTIVPPKGARPGPCPSGSASGMLAQMVAKGGVDRDGIAAPVMTFSAHRLPEPAAYSHASALDANVQPIAALPLCDTARHLRSGVQLA
jgi:hypothetical protein